MLKFVTGNKNKFEEVQAILGDTVEMLKVDLPEVQSLDSHVIIRTKLEEAVRQGHSHAIVEDTSLYIEGMNGLPGPLIKWFLESIGPEGLFKLGSVFGFKAIAIVCLGYVSDAGVIEYFEGEISGALCAPTSSAGFGFDTVFVPDGYSQSFAEMGKEEKNKISHRRIALEKLKEYLS
jgi:non-canonical purine NTP pyrophosphatase (RdgB/HAM1 family)